MPQIFKVGAYWIYFWSNECKPLEPIHFHISLGSPTANATKVWITKQGKCYLCNNNSQIPLKTLHNIISIAEARSDEIITKWLDFFGEISYFC